MPTPNKIELRNVQKFFNGKPVLQGISADIKQGETFVILGGSGSGKSVLLKCILGLMNPSDGLIRVDGEDTHSLPKKKRLHLMRKFGMLFQNGALFDSLTIWENVAFGLLQDGMKPKDAQEKAMLKLKQVGLKSDVGLLMPDELSGGMRKRAALARAICLEPEIIFYDEPTTGLDPITADVINELILQLQAELGVTSVVITHNMKSAYKIGNQLAMLHEGKFLTTGTASEFENASNPYVHQFVNGLAEGPIKMTF